MLLARVNQTSISVEARGQIGNSLELLFRLTDAEIGLLRIDLINQDGMSAGSCVCAPTEPCCFVANATHGSLRAWSMEGEAAPYGKRLQLRMCLRLDGHEFLRSMSVDLNNITETVVSDIRTKRNIWTLSGTC